jgi:outer membrane protein OmpA-like peptidoglycan-associated protein
VTRRLAVAAAVAALAGCAGSSLKVQNAAVGEEIAVARANGAVRCAPVELAMAEAHHDFAAQDLAEGNYHAAQRQLEVARKNAALALANSPKERCNPDPLPPEAPPPPPEAPKDTDGDGLLDPVDECPRKPEDLDGFQDEDGCPEDDNDGDGIGDKIDDCPMDPEDRDGFDDTDGCADLDNDRDGLADAVDQCPEVPEDQDGFEDDDGCPDCDNDGDGVPECPDAIDKCPAEAAPGTPDGCAPKYELIVVTEEKIELKQTVFFDTKKATIQRKSFDLLDEVAQALADRPAIKVRIEGHTDSQGKDAFNKTLSQKRAEAVKAYLVGRGIDEARMTPVGFGEEVPIADNRTDAGRAQNRRVEFFIVEQ